MEDHTNIGYPLNTGLLYQEVISDETGHDRDFFSYINHESNLSSENKFFLRTPSCNAKKFIPDDLLHHTITKRFPT